MTNNPNDEQLEEFDRRLGMGDKDFTGFDGMSIPTAGITQPPDRAMQWEDYLPQEKQPLWRRIISRK